MIFFFFVDKCLILWYIGRRLCFKGLGKAMKYIFFDIECANCYQGKGKICSFGYVITDSSFRIVEQHDMIMNPDSKFNLGPDIKLAYDRATFKKSPLFPMFYDEIEALLTDSDAIVLGFSVNNDARYIRDECIRYHLPEISYRFYDVQQMFMAYENMKNQPSLSGLCEQCHVHESQEIHKSDEDARMTMVVLKQLCQLTGKSVQQLITEYPRCVGEVKDGEVKWVYAPPKEIKTQVVGEEQNSTKRKKFSNRLNRFCPNFKAFKRYLASLHPTEGLEGDLAGKKICISANYEERHYREMKKIAEKISTLGGVYSQTTTEIDIFVDYPLARPDGTQKICPRSLHVQKMNKQGQKVVVWDFDRLLNVLNLTMEDLEAAKMGTHVDLPEK